MSALDDGRGEDPEPVSAGSSPVSLLPSGLTPAAISAFRDVEEEFREGLSAELRRRRRHHPDLTSVDVYEARAVVTHAMRESGARRRGGSLVALGPGLIAIGSVGVGAMHPYLHSSWQVAALALLAVVGLTGVGTTWRSGRSRNTRDSTPG